MVTLRLIDRKTEAPSNHQKGQAITGRGGRGLKGAEEAIEGIEGGPDHAQLRPTLPVSSLYQLSLPIWKKGNGEGILNAITGPCDHASGAD